MEWSQGFVNPLELLLDTDNPRIDITPEMQQEAIRESLLKTERVIELAREIIDAHGLLMGERIIVVKENRNYVVLEGNRRVAACQMLLEPKKVPRAFRAKFPRLDPEEDADLIRTLSSVPADIAPTRDAAEITITRRHTKKGILPWLPAAQHRRIRRLIDSGKSVDDVADIFGVSKSDLTRLLRSSELMRLVTEQGGWTEYEKEFLGNPKLKINPFTRFFTLKGVKETLGMDFDKNGSLTTDLNKRTLNRAVKELARALLIPDPDTGKPRFNTRATPLEVFESAFSSDEKLSGLIPKARRAASIEAIAPPPRKRKSPPNKKTSFFESLQCATGDDILDGVADELSRINYQKFPRAAAVLARSTMECALNWAISLSNLDRELRKTYQQRNPGLENIIRFCVSRHDDIFGQPVKRILEQWLSTHKDYCDLIVHGKFLLANVNSLEHLARETRPFLQRLVDRELFKESDE